MASPQFNQELAKWREAVNALSKVSSRTAPKFINGQLLALALRAIKQTRKVLRAKIAWELGRNVEGIGTTRSGGRNFKQAKIGEGFDSKRGAQGSFAARIINARRKRDGRPMIWGAALEGAALKLSEARKFSGAFIKSGWLPSTRILLDKVFPDDRKKRATEADVKQVGRAKGGAAAAKEGGVGLTARGAIWNTALIVGGRFSDSKKSNPYRHAEAGLRRAIRWQTKDMTRELQRRLGRELRKRGIKAEVR